MYFSNLLRICGRAERSALILILGACLGGAAGWLISQRYHSSPQLGSSPARKILFYQSPMHPWIKSDRPGTCTICGMKLVPIYEGDDQGGLQKSRAGIALSRQAATAIHVETTPVKRQTLKRTVHVAGVIDDDDSRHRRLSAYVDGRIDRLSVNYVGAEVEEGQPLVAIYSRELLVARSEYTLATKMSPGPDRESAVSATRRKLQRMGLTSKQIDKLSGETGDTIEIVSPIGGTVVSRNVYEGQYVKEGDVLFEIADFTKMWFVFDAYERDLAWIRLGQTVEITTPSVPGKIYKATISFIDPNLTPQTRSARIRVELENPRSRDPAKHQHELLHKVYADGRIQVESETTLVIPRSAVLSPGTEPYVYVEKEEGRYGLMRILLGRAGDDTWEVIDGLNEGEKVVTTGNLLIDSQAQLERGQTDPPSILEVMPPLTEGQVEVARRFLTAVSVESEALAADNLPRYNERLELLRDASVDLAKALGEHGRPLSRAAELPPPDDLPAARKDFYRLSMAAADLVMQWRKQRSAVATEVRVFQCPMAKSAVPSAETNNGRWLQLTGTIRNPYFGAEMLECGEEVKP